MKNLKVSDTFNPFNPTAPFSATALGRIAAFPSDPIDEPGPGPGIYALQKLQQFRIAQHPVYVNS